MAIVLRVFVAGSVSVSVGVFSFFLISLLIFLFSHSIPHLNLFNHSSFCMFCCLPVFLLLVSLFDVLFSLQLISSVIMSSVVSTMENASFIICI